MADRPDALAAFRAQVAALTDRAEQPVVHGGAAPGAALEEHGLRVVPALGIEDTRRGAGCLLSDAS